MVDGVKVNLDLNKVIGGLGVSPEFKEFFNTLSKAVAEPVAKVEPEVKVSGGVRAFINPEPDWDGLVVILLVSNSGVVSVKSVIKLGEEDF